MDSNDVPLKMTAQEKKEKLANAGKKKQPSLPKKSPKRRAKDEKYGFGGKKRKLAKRNTAESSASFEGFNAAKNRSVPKDLKVLNFEILHSIF